MKSMQVRLQGRGLNEPDSWELLFNKWCVVCYPDSVRVSFIPLGLTMSVRTVGPALMFSLGVLVLCVHLVLNNPIQVKKRVLMS